MVNDPMFAQRRRRRLRNPDAPIFDDSMLGGPVMDLEDDPFGGDREIRNEAYAQMGQFLKEDLNRTRQRGEYFVERGGSGSEPRDSSQQIQRPRPVTITPTSARYASPSQQVRVESEPDEDYYDSDPDERGYPDEDEDDEELYDGHDEYRQETDNEREPPVRRDRRDYPLERDNRSYPRSQGGYQEDRTRGRRLPPRRTERYPEHEDRTDTPYGPRSTTRKSAPPQRLPRPRVRPTSEGRPRDRPVSPSRPALLAPDGTIPRHPCGDFLVTYVGPMKVTIECQEERREQSEPYHPNMPHIARINAPPGTSNATAFFVWNHERG